MALYVISEPDPGAENLLVTSSKRIAAVDEEGKLHQSTWFAHSVRLRFPACCR